MSLSGPESCYSFASRKAARRIARLYDQHLSPAHIKTSQFTLLTMIARSPGVKVAVLAEAMVMERTTLVRALKPLQEAGWVETRAAGSGRALGVFLTPAGEAKMLEAEPYWLAAQQAFEASLGPEEAHRLRASNLAISSAALG